MKITVNGKVKEIQDGINALELLNIQEVKMPDMVTVEINGEIIYRENLEETVIKENDEIEFLYFMGGGAVEF